MRTVVADLTAYCSYNCPYCEANDSMFFESDELMNMDENDLDITVECASCDKEFKIDQFI